MFSAAENLGWLQRCSDGMRLPDGDDVDVRTLMRRRFRAPASARMLFLLLVVHVRCGAGIGEPVRTRGLNLVRSVHVANTIRKNVIPEKGMYTSGTPAVYFSCLKQGAVFEKSDLSC